MKNENGKVFRVGAQVEWNWMGRAVRGIVKKIYFRPVSREFRGHLFKRNGSSDSPAYLVRTKAGSDVLKGHAELRGHLGASTKR